MQLKKCLEIGLEKQLISVAEAMRYVENHLTEVVSGTLCSPEMELVVLKHDWKMILERTDFTEETSIEEVFSYLSEKPLWCECIMYDDWPHMEKVKRRTDCDSLNRYVNGSFDITPLGENSEFELITNSESKSLFPASGYYLINAGEYDEDTVALGQVWDFLSGKALVRKADKSDFSEDDFNNLQQRLLAQDDICKCECGRTFGKTYMRYTKDYHGIPMRRLCFSCYEKAMEKGYDGIPYSEEEY